RARFLRTFVSDRPDFGHAVMVEHARTRPEPLDVSARRWNAAARFARDDDRADARCTEVDAVALRDFTEPDRVRRRAAEHAGAVVKDHLEPRFAAQPAAGDREHSELCRG